MTFGMCYEKSPFMTLKKVESRLEWAMHQGQRIKKY